MTTIEALETPSAEPRAQEARWWQTLDRQLEKLGDRLNPILVKETRQALKSKQFAVTFALVLITSWLWSVLAIYLRYPGILYSPDGPFLLVGYFDILLFPLVVIIPFTAFRSLASEREDGTFELLSISTLSPRQIITGKLISSVLQMLVYLSALAPCIGFTYLLRGVDIVTILFVVTVAFLVSVLLSAVGLVLACVTQQRHWQSALSVVVILLFLFLFFIGLIISYGSIIEDAGWRMFDEADFWLVMAMLLTFYLSYLHLVIQVAAAQITFASENRSAGIRTAALLQHFLAIGWTGYYWLRFEMQPSILLPLMTILTLHWFLIGAFMNGESPVISPRVKRAIPRTLFERLLLNWRIPGPERGYFFAVCGIISALAVVIACCATSWSMGKIGQHVDAEMLVAYAVGLASYAIIYLGLGRVCLQLLHLTFRTDIFISMIVHILLLMFGMLIPVSLQLASNRTLDPTFRHLSNPFWFVAEVLDDPSFVLLPDQQMLIFSLALIAILVLSINVLLGAGELVPTSEKTKASIPLPDPLLDQP